GRAGGAGSASRGDVRGRASPCQRETQVRACRPARTQLHGHAMASAQLAMIVDMFRRSPPVPQDMDIATRRQRREDRTPAAPRPDGTRVTPVVAGGVPSEWVEVPGGSSTPTILSLRGGGDNGGSLRASRAV